MFACAPHDAPSVGDLPDRGAAAFRGSAVAGAPVTAREKEGGGTLRRRLIRLVASFTRMSVKDTIMELKDESGRTWYAMSNEGRDNAVDSIPLPDAGISTAAAAIGSCEAVSGDDATAVFEDTRTAGRAEPGVFSVRFTDDAGEALGVWGAFDIDGALGPKRTGSVAGPRLPVEVHSEGEAARGSMHWITEGTPG